MHCYHPEPVHRKAEYKQIISSDYTWSPGKRIRIPASDPPLRARHPLISKASGGGVGIPSPNSDLGALLVKLRSALEVPPQSAVVTLD